MEEERTCEGDMEDLHGAAAHDERVVLRVELREAAPQGEISGLQPLGHFIQGLSIFRLWIEHTRLRHRRGGRTAPPACGVVRRRRRRRVRRTIPALCHCVPAGLARWRLRPFMSASALRSDGVMRLPEPVSLHRAPRLVGTTAASLHRWAREETERAHGISLQNHFPLLVPRRGRHDRAHSTATYMHAHRTEMVDAERGAGAWDGRHVEGAWKSTRARSEKTVVDEMHAMACGCGAWIKHSATNACLTGSCRHRARAPAGRTAPALRGPHLGGGWGRSPLGRAGGDRRPRT